MDRLFAGPRQPLAHIGGFQPAHPAQLDRRVVADPLTDRLAVERDLDRVAGVELAGDLDDPDRQQAGAALAQRAGRAGIDLDPPANRAWRTSATA